MYLKNETQRQRFESPLAKLFLLQRGEGTALFWSAGYFFFLLFGYFLIRPVRDALGISRGAENLPWPMTATMIVMFCVSPLFSGLVSRMPRRRFIPLTHHIVSASLILFYIALRWKVSDWTGWAFYVWVSVLNLFLVSVFWAFMNDCHGSDRARRLFGMIGVGGTLGAFLGSLANRKLVGGFWLAGLGEVKLDPYTMLPLCVLSWEFAIVWMKMAGRHAVAPERMSETPARSGGAFQGMLILVRSPYLMLIAAYVFIYALTSTFLYLQQGRLIEQSAPDTASRTAAFADISTWTQGVTLLVQLLVTGHLIRFLGVGLTLALLPAVTIGGFVLLGMHPTPDALVVFQVVRGAVHYAVDRPTRETLYSSLSVDAKYKTKSFIDTFIYRGGDFSGTWLPKGLAWAGVSLTAVAVGAGVVWCLIAAGVGIMQSRRGAEAKPD